MVALAFGSGSLAMVDQVVVSGTRFLTTILVGRIAGVSQLGLYVIGFATIVLGVCIQESMITTPYAVYANRRHGRGRKLYAGGALLQHIALAAMSIVALGAIALVSQFVFHSSKFSLLFAMLTFVVPSSLSREFVRRMAFAHLNMRMALIFDGATAAIQVAVLMALVSLGSLATTTALMAAGIACLVTSVTWLIVRRDLFLFRLRYTRRVWAMNWSFGRWMAAGEVSGAMTSYTPTLVLAAGFGTIAVGVYAACESIIRLCNPIILGVNNFIVPKTANAYSQGGRKEIKRVVGVMVASMVSMMLVLVGVLLTLGDFVVRLLYGSEFQNHGSLVAVMALSIPLWGASCVLAGGLCAIEKTDDNFRAKLSGLGIAFLCCISLALAWGPHGAAIGLFAGSLATVVYQAAAFHRFTSSPESSGETARHAESSITVRMQRFQELSPEQIHLWAEIQSANPSLDNPLFCAEFSEIVASVRDDVEVAIIEQHGCCKGFFPFHRDQKNVGRPVASIMSDLHGVVVPDGFDFSPLELVRGCGLKAWHFDHLVASQEAFEPFVHCVGDSPYMDLVAGFDSYAQQRSQAGSSIIRQAKRKSRKIGRDIGPLRFVLHEDRREVIDALINWKQSQLLEMQSVDVLSIDWVVELIRRISKFETPRFQGLLSALYAGDQLLSVHLGMRSEDVVSSWIPTFNPNYRQYSPGLLMHLELARAAADAGVTRIDLCRGSNQLKTSLSSGSFSVAFGSVDSRMTHRVMTAAWYGARKLAHSTPFGEWPLAAYRCARSVASRPRKKRTVS